MRRWTLLIAATLSLAGCGKSTQSTCRYEPATGTNGWCADFQSGYSDSDVAATCTVQGARLDSAPCEEGYARCVIASDGRMFTFHFSRPGDETSARMTCAVGGGTFEVL